MGKTIIPKGGQDNIMTPPELAEKIVKHFNPVGAMLEPCAGDFAFVNAMPNCEWCEINKGKDFFELKENNKHYDWIITNPPYSQFRAFLKHSMQLSYNVVFLCLVNAFFFKARLKDIQEANFGFKEIVFVDTPPKPWPQFGIQLGAVYINYKYNGPAKFSYLK